MSVLEGSSILVTGGTGSFGKAFLRYVLDNENPRRVVVFSRDELKQHEVRRQFDVDPRLRWFIGDIRDRQRLERAPGAPAPVQPARTARSASAYSPGRLLRISALLEEKGQHVGMVVGMDL